LTLRIAATAVALDEEKRSASIGGSRPVGKGAAAADARRSDVALLSCMEGGSEVAAAGFGECGSDGIAPVHGVSTQRLLPLCGADLLDARRDDRQAQTAARRGGLFLGEPIARRKRGSRRNGGSAR
jgi:hypothetical protein